MSNPPEGKVGSTSVDIGVGSATTSPAQGGKGKGKGKYKGKTKDGFEHSDLGGPNGSMDGVLGKDMSNGEKWNLTETIYVRDPHATFYFYCPTTGVRLLERDMDVNGERANFKDRIEQCAKDVTDNALTNAMRSAPLTLGPKPDGSGVEIENYRRLAGAATLCEGCYYNFHNHPDDPDTQYVLSTGFPKDIDFWPETPDWVMNWAKGEGDF